MQPRTVSPDKASRVGRDSPGFSLLKSPKKKSPRKSPSKFRQPYPTVASICPRKLLWPKKPRTNACLHFLFKLPGVKLRFYRWPNWPLLLPLFNKLNYKYLKTVLKDKFVLQFCPLKLVLWNLSFIAFLWLSSHKIQDERLSKMHFLWVYLILLVYSN